jgi:glycosyltransferase involved in cell wall biosynthesis
MHASAEDIVEYVRRSSSKANVFLRVNENDARKGTTGVDKRLLDLSAHVDGTIFVSQWLQDHFLSIGWGCSNNTVIHNGVDGSAFRKRGYDEKLKNSSDQRYHRRINLVAHHWSDNRLKGADIYEALDEFVALNTDFSFTYIGRTKSNLRHTYILPPAPADELGRTLGLYDVYVSGSRFDPGPNHILEALACGLPTYVHKDGGGCVEFAGADHTFDDWAHLRNILAYKLFLPNQSFTLPTWQECASQYVEFMERTMSR